MQVVLQWDPKATDNKYVQKKCGQGSRNTGILGILKIL